MRRAGWGPVLPIKRELSLVVRGQTKITSPQPGDLPLQILGILQKLGRPVAAGHSATFIDVVENVVEETLHGLLDAPPTSPAHLLMHWTQQRSIARMGWSVGLSVRTESMTSPTMVRSPSAMESFLRRRLFLSLHSLQVVLTCRSSRIAKAWSTRTVLMTISRRPCATSSTARITCCSDDTAIVWISAIFARRILLASIALRPCW